MKVQGSYVLEGKKGDNNDEDDDNDNDNDHTKARSRIEE